MPATARAEHLGEQEHERQNRQNRDVAAGHVRRKSHRQRERPDEHAHDFDRDQQDVDRPGQPVRHQVLPVLARSRAPSMPATMIAPKVIVASAAVTLKFAGRGRAAVQQLLDERIARRCAARSGRAAPSTSKIGISPIAFAQRMKRKNVRSSGVQVLHPLLADVRLRRCRRGRTRPPPRARSSARTESAGPACR